MMSVMRSAPSSSNAQRVSSAEHRSAPRRARARRRHDVPELDLAPLAVDVDRQREADEAPVVVERGEGLARAVEPARLVAVEPLARVAGRRRNGQAREAQDVGIVEEGGDVVEVLGGQRPQRDGHG